jgi:hypothetical protein
MTRLAILPLLILLVLLGAAPAVAKGPIDVTVSGPGVDSVRIDAVSAPGGVTVQSLADRSGLFAIYGAEPLGPAPDLSTEELGPRFTLTWGLGEEAADGAPIVTHVYPFAAGGPWSFVPDGQSLFGGPVGDGWIGTDPSLTKLLVRLGAERPGATTGATTGATSAVAAGTTGTTGADSRGEAGTPTPDRTSYVAGAGLLLVALLAGGAVLHHRRRSVALPA